MAQAILAQGSGSRSAACVLRLFGFPTRARTWERANPLLSSGKMIGGAWGGVFVRWGVGYAFHGYCFGYCTYVLVCRPLMIETKNYLDEKFPSLMKSPELRGIPKLDA